MGLITSAYYNSNKNRYNNSWYGNKRSYKSKKKTKYTQAEMRKCIDCVQKARDYFKCFHFYFAKGADVVNSLKTVEEFNSIIFL